MHVLEIIHHRKHNLYLTCITQLNGHKSYVIVLTVGPITPVCPGSPRTPGTPCK